ncbi:MAG: FAD-dependent oxidoreductase, partial [Ignavibacteriae bacterium]|nr:FAD-dependent oxidoreductase [Ignavibacteriota bacterium]
MKREIEKLKNEKFDLLVVGGGIHGALIVWEAARNGYKSCLIEKNDFGSQTSANSLKVLHGGFRYIQHANIKRMRESIYSRKVFQQIAPHLVKNIPFLFPTAGFNVKSRPALAVALFLNDIISADRNKNILAESKVPCGRTISKSKLEKIVPDLENKNINGGAVWYETVALNTERLLFEFLFEANKNGAELANYVKAEELVIEENEVKKVRVKDELTDEEFYINADFIVDSVGPWLNKFLTPKTNYDVLKSPLTKAVNIIIKKNYFKEYAVGIESTKEFKDKDAIINKGKRLFFLVPIGDYTMIGTTYKVYEDDPDNCKISEYDLQEIINEVNESYKDFKIKLEDVVQSHAGILPMQNLESSNEFDVQPDKHSLVFDHKGNVKNLISVKSVKYTTAPSIAKKVIEVLKIKNANASVGNKNQKISLENYSKIKDEFYNTNSNYGSTLLERLWNTYGVRSSAVINYIEQNDESKKLIFDSEEIYLGEVIYNYENEMAVTSNDIIDRRLGLSAFEKVSNDVYKKVVEILKKLNHRELK